jgi:NTE family protein
VDTGDGGLYWDGLFSDNPPTGELIRDDVVGAENIPDEIWVIKINPTLRSRAPTAPDEIVDRRNELYGNISLFHQLANIAKLNDLFLADAFRPEFLATSPIKHMIRIPRAFGHKPVMAYHMPCIEMSRELQESLDYESKLDRSPKHLRRLFEDGQARAAEFLRIRAEPLSAG